MKSKLSKNEENQTCTGTNVNELLTDAGFRCNKVLSGIKKSQAWGAVCAALIILTMALLWASLLVIVDECQNGAPKVEVRK